MDIKAYFANIPKRQQYILAGLLSVGLVFGYFYYLWKPLNGEKVRLTRDLENLQRELNEKRRIASDLDRLQEEINTLQGQLKEAMAILPEEKEVPSLLTQISTLGTQTGISFLLFKPGTLVSRDFYSEFPIQIRVEGTYHSLGLFLDRISKMKRIVNVSDLKIRGQTSKKHVGSTILAEFNAVTFTFSIEGGKEADVKKTKQ